MESKICTKCGERKQIDKFYNLGKKKDGTIKKNNKCKSCSDEIKKRWYKKNKEHAKKIQKRWVEKNKEHVKEIQKRWVKENKEYVNEKIKRWVKKNKEHAKEIKKKWYEENKEHVKEKKKQETDKLADCYVIKCLLNKTTISKKDIKQYPELIEAHRLIIKTKRLWKTLNN